MSEYDELIRLQLQKRFKSPVGVRENEETVYANVACEPLMLDLVRQIHVLQINQTRVSYELSFKNTEHPEFDIILPEDISAEFGTEIILPSLSGEYEDYKYIYTPEKWNVGAFGDTIILNDNIVADLIWHTWYKLTFTNTDYPEFDVDLPKPIKGEDGTKIVLPSVYGEYEDSGYIYTPQSWDIGSFGSSVTLSDSIIANLVWCIWYSLSFVNTSHPEFDINLPTPIKGKYGDNIILPSLSGEYDDSNYTYIPESWSIGNFGETFILNENVVADLVWKILYKLTFTNTEYPEFDINIPDPIKGEYGTEVVLPNIYGEYKDSEFIYIPESWSIGNFGDTIILNDNTVANLLWQAIPIGPVYPQGQFLYGEMQTNPNKQVTLNAIPIEESSNELMTVTGNAIWLIDHPFIPDEGFDMVLGLNGLMEEWVPPVIVLPEVTKIGDLRIAPNGFEQQLASGSSKILYEQTSNSYKGILYDDTTKKQCVYGWDRIVSGAWEKHYYGVSAVLMNTGNLGVINNTQSTIYVYYIRYAECSDPTAEVITVYDSLDNPFNAFKYSLEGTDYYYVLDGVQTDWTDDLGSIGYYLHTSEIDIDVNWGDAVTIPEGYTIQSMKSTVAYMFKNFSHSSMTELMVYSAPGTKDLYCTDTDISLMGWRVAPCLQIFQITTINSQNSYSGYYLTNRISQTSTTEFTLNTAFSLLNVDYSGSGFFLRYQASGPADARNSVANSTYPLQFRRYDENDALIEYYFNVPTTLWRLQNGVFQWLGDSRQNQDLAFYYFGRNIRIHCVRA